MHCTPARRLVLLHPYFSLLCFHFRRAQLHQWMWAPSFPAPCHIDTFLFVQRKTQTLLFFFVQIAPRLYLLRAVSAGSVVCLYFFILQYLFQTFEVAFRHFCTSLTSYALAICTSTPLVAKHKHKKITLCRFCKPIKGFP